VTYQMGNKKASLSGWPPF